MSMELVKAFLGWNALANYALLLFWFGAFVLAHDWVYGLHSRWFKISPETFDAIHYGAIAGYKLAIFLLFLLPYLVLQALT